jgi:Holliday junction resolvase
VTSAYDRAKGSIFETGILKLFRTIKGVFAERLTRAGSKDEGDLVVVIAGKTYILELKNRKKLDLPQFWREAQVEALNYAKARGIGEVPPAYVIVKRRNAGLEKSWVVCDLEQWLKEKQMPTPQGDITSTETWSETPAEEVVEESTDESDDTEQA